MKGRARKAWLAVAVLALMVIAAGGGAMWWGLGSRGSDVFPSTAELLLRAGVVVVTEEEASLTFPLVNTWEAPLQPVQPGSAVRLRFVCHVGPPREFSILPRRPVVRVQVTRKMFVAFKGLLEESEGELRKRIRSAAKGGRREVPLTDRASREVAAAWLAWAADVSRQPGERTWLIDCDLEDLVENLRAREEIEWWPELVVRDGFLWLEWGEVPPMRSASSAKRQPMLPKLGDSADWLARGKMWFVRRETIRVNGGVFRCWVIEGERKGTHGPEKRVEWHAPGIGLVSALYWDRLAVGTGRIKLFERYREELLIQSIEEVLLPEDGVYWKAAEASE